MRSLIPLNTHDLLIILETDVEIVEEGVSDYQGFLGEGWVVDNQHREHALT